MKLLSFTDHVTFVVHIESVETVRIEKNALVGLENPKNETLLCLN